MKITVDYGYDVHSIEVSDSEWEKIRSGKALTLTGQGFYVEGELEEDIWFFNEDAKGSVRVNAEDSREIFVGTVEDLSCD